MRGLERFSWGATAGLSSSEESFRGNDENETFVIPGKAGGRDPESRKRKLDSRLRGNDGHTLL